MFTLYEKYGHIDGLKVAICGDLYHSRVVRSNVIGLTKLGATVSVAGPRTMVPVGLDKMGCTVCKSVAEAVKDADALVLVTEWQEFRFPNWEQVRRAMKQPLVIDGRNIYPREVMAKAGFTLSRIG